MPEREASVKRTIICLDRDGTLIHDEGYHLFLGKDDDWRRKVRMLPGVIDGLKKLKNMPGSAIYMITNQPGVSISDYPLLTPERAHEVCKYVINKIRKMGAVIDGYFLCPHATPEYVSKKPELNFDARFVHECDCSKPALGMVFSTLKAEQVTVDDAIIYVIGDRATDVQTALNIEGSGVLIPFENEPGEEEKVRKLKNQSHVYIAKDFLDAADIIFQRNNNV
jgi:histidinol-phosphate phosphatase family protein